MTVAVFDLDGTLIDSAPAIMRVGNRLLADHDAPPLTPEETRSFIGHGAARFVEQAFAARDIVVGNNMADAVVLFEKYYAEGDPSENAPFPGVEHSLDALRGAGVTLALCTNKPGAATRAVLDGLGWASRFAAVVAGDTLNSRKPDPAPLREALLRSGGGSMVYVGDSEVDAETARRAGAPFILYTEGYRHAPVDAIPHDRAFSDFHMLPGLVRAVVEQRC